MVGSWASVVAAGAGTVSVLANEGVGASAMTGVGTGVTGFSSSSRLSSALNTAWHWPQRTLPARAFICSGVMRKTVWQFGQRDIMALALGQAAFEPARQTQPSRVSATASGMYGA